MRYERHIFVCTNRRDPSHHRGAGCGTQGGEEVRAKFKQILKERGLKSRFRANTAGCLDTCEFGVTAVVYPDGIWYSGITVDDVEEIIDSHLIGGVPVERLRLPHKKYTPGAVGDAEPESSGTGPDNASSGEGRRSGA